MTRTVTLGALFPNIKIGWTPPRENAEYFWGWLPWVSIKDLSSGKVIEKTNETLSELWVRHSNVKKISKGSLLFSFKLTVWKVAFAWTELYTNEAIAAFESGNPDVLLEYLYYCLPIYAKRVSRTNNYGAPLLNKEVLKELEIPLPSIEEQREIVSKLDKISGLIAMKKDGIRKMEALTRSIFFEVFWKDMYHQHLNTAFRDLVSEFRYGTSQKSWEAWLPVLRIPNIVNWIDLRDLKYCELSNSERERLILENGDILFVRTNWNPAFVWRNAVFDLKDQFVFASYLIRARLKNDLIDPYYLLAYLRLPEWANQIRAAIKTSAGQYNINIEGLWGLMIPVPELSKQREFASILAEVECLLSQHNSALQNLQSLYDTTSQEIFK